MTPAIAAIDRQRLGQRSAAEQLRALAQEPPHRHQEQAFVFQRVGECRGAVRAHDLDALQKAVRRAAVDHLLDDQRPNHAGRLGASSSSANLASSSRGSDERQNRDRLGVRFVDVRIERRFDLRRQVRRVAREPHVFARLHDRGRQLAEHHGHVRALVERVLAADGLDRAPAAVADRHAHAVAADQPPAFVGDRVGRFADVELFVGRRA